MRRLALGGQRLQVGIRVNRSAALVPDPFSLYRFDAGTDRPLEAVRIQLFPLRVFPINRPSWSRELLVREMVKRTGVQVSRSTLGICLKILKALWGRARPWVLCPWRKARRQRRLREIRAMLSALKPGAEAFYVDEVDSDLNPRIGPDWTLPGQQRWVLTPGQNETRYLAGALNHRTGHLV